METSFGEEIFPCVGCCNPAIIFSSVDFPAPFLPTSATRSFLFRTNEIWLSSVNPPNSTVRLSMEIIYWDKRVPTRSGLFLIILKAIRKSLHLGVKRIPIRSILLVSFFIPRTIPIIHILNQSGFYGIVNCIFNCIIEVSVITNGSIKTFFLPK